MLRKSAVTLFVIFLVLPTIQAFGYDDTFVLSRAEFDALTITQGGLTFNNFMIVEKESLQIPGQAAIRLTFSAINKSESLAHIGFMVLGLNDKSQPIWTLRPRSMQTILINLNPQTAETWGDGAYVSPGDLEKTKTIWIRIIGDF